LNTAACSASKAGRSSVSPLSPWSVNQRTPAGSMPLPASQRSISARWLASFWLTVDTRTY
jgi:hypothetical protein